MAHADRAPRLTRRSVLRLGAAACGALTLPLLGACQPTAPGGGQSGPAAQSKPTEVNIGAIFPTTGELAKLGQTCLNGAQLATEDINAAGGIKALGGAKINLISTDSRGDDKVTRTETERIITSNKLSAINGAYASANSLIASEVTERSKIPFITGSIANALVERGFKYIFQVAPRASQFGDAQARLAAEASEGRKVAIVYENTAYGTSTSKGTQEVAQKAGFDVVLFEPYERSFTDAGPLVNKIKASGANILFPVAYLNDTILIVRTMKQQAVRAPVVAAGAGPLQPDFIRAFGEDGNGVLSIGSWNKDLNEEAVAINKRYEAKYGEFIQEHAGEVYVFMYVLLDALERAGSADPEAVREALTKTDLTKGTGAVMPGGRIQFDEKGWNPNAVPVGVQWQNQDLVTVYPKEFAKASIVKIG